MSEQDAPDLTGVPRSHQSEVPDHRSRGLRYAMLVGGTTVLAAMGLGNALEPSADAMDRGKLGKGKTDASCSGNIQLNLSPGLQLFNRTQGTNNSGSKTEILETGRLDCTGGAFEGYRITGPGGVGFMATYDGRCLQTDGGGTWSFTIPIRKRGREQWIHRAGTYTGPSKLKGTKITIDFDGQFPGGQLGGEGNVKPLTPWGCLFIPLTQADFNFTDLKLTR